MTKRPKCLTCEKTATAVGLCNACRQAAYRAMRTGKVDRQQLVDKGLILPSRRGRPAGPWTQKANKVLA